MVSKTELKNARGRNSFVQKGEFGVAPVGFEIAGERPGGDIENTVVYRSWSSGKKSEMQVG